MAERLEKLSEYFKEKDRKKLTSEVISKWGDGSPPLMTEAEIKLSCLENNGYEAPELNEKIYLHFRGFKRIENLDKYTECKALWLDSNGFDKIEGLQSLTQLRCLYLSKNLINSIENLHYLPNLVQLDLSNNRISHLQNLSCCPNLESLNLQRNYLATGESIAHLIECPKLVNLDLQNNKLPAEESVIEVIFQFPAIANLQLNGNEVTRLPTFRKRMIYRMPKIGYLDRPIEELERICANAFMEGGQEAEQAAREKYRLDKAEEKKIELQNFKLWQKEMQEKRAIDRQNGVSTPYVGYTASPEDEEKRLIEAKKAWDDEQAALSGGIGKLASKYWEIEGRKDNKSGDSLDEAMKAVLKEKERADINDIDDSEDEASEEVDNDQSAASTATQEIEEVSEESEPVINAEDAKIIEEQAAQKAAEEAARIKAEKEEALRIKKEEEARQQLVAESLAMYKRQLAEEKENAERKAKGLPPLQRANAPSKVSNGWTNFSKTESAGESEGDSDSNASAKQAVFRWTENLDIELASRIRKSKFDFTAVSEEIHKLALSGALGLVVQLNAASITPESCRIRWSELDAEKWSQVSPDVNALDTIYKVCIKPPVLGQGHGAQPSFQALNSLASSSFPKYLTPPALLPSVDDMDSDEDEAGEVTVESKNDV